MSICVSPDPSSNIAPRPSASPSW